MQQNLVQLNRGTIFAEPKTARSRRQVALSPHAVTILGAAKRRQAEDRLKAGSAYEDSGLVFTKPSGAKHDPSTVSHKFAAIGREAGFPGLRMHDLRHTHATLLLAQGVHPKIVQGRLGHATIAMTMDVYSHVLPGLQEAAAAKLDEILGHRSGTKTEGRPS